MPYTSIKRPKMPSVFLSLSRKIGVPVKPIFTALGNAAIM